MILSLALWIAADFSVEAKTCHNAKNCPPTHACLRHNNGSGRSRKCVFIDCGDPAPVNGQASTPSGTTFNQIASLSCGPGYDLSGSITVKCLETGEWDGKATCTIKDCGDPIPINGSVIGDVFTVDASVTIECDEGYQPSQDDTVITCQTDGTWNSTITCEETGCGDPTPLNGGILGNMFTTGSYVTVRCHLGYQRTPPVHFNIICQDDGTWNSTITCEAVIDIPN